MRSTRGRLLVAPLLLLAVAARAEPGVPERPDGRRFRVPRLLAASHSTSPSLLSSHRQGPAAQADCPAGRTQDGEAIRAIQVAQALHTFTAGAGVFAAVPMPPQPPPQARPVNFVDVEIFTALDRAGVRPAPRANDAEFLRRVTLDLTGRIPDFETTVRFLSDPSAGKRERKIDELIASDAFTDRFTFFFDELFRVTAYSTTSFLGFKGRDAWHAYFRDAVRQNRPYDRIVREVLTGTGLTWNSGPANFVVREVADGPMQDTFDNLAATTGRAALGLNLFCVSCHGGAGHVEQLNLWLATQKRQDFWGTAAFFSHADVDFEYLPATMEFKFTVFDRHDGAYTLDTADGNKSPRQPGPDGRVDVDPRFILNGQGPRPGEAGREALARIVTGDRQFARAAVNYVWRELFSLGIVEPADSFDLLRLDAANPPPAPWTLQPTHPALLEKLAIAFEEGGYDLRALVRLIVRSNAYQLSSFYPGEWRDAYLPLFARHYPRRLRAEDLVDSLTVATGAPFPMRVEGWAEPVLWANQLPDVIEPLGGGPDELSSLQSALVYVFLDAFSRGDRDARARTSEGSVVQTLHQMNNPLVTLRVRADFPQTIVSVLLRSDLSPTQTVDVLYVATLSRPPTEAERTRALAVLTDGRRGRAEALEDLHFSLLNKIDFLFNY